MTNLTRNSCLMSHVVDNFIFFRFSNEEICSVHYVQLFLVSLFHEKHLVCPTNPYIQNACIFSAIAIVFVVSCGFSNEMFPIPLKNVRRDAIVAMHRVTCLPSYSTVFLELLFI